MATPQSAIIRTVVTDRYTGESVTMPAVRVRWSENNRRQSAILQREAYRAADRAAGAMGWLADLLDTDTNVIRSGPSARV